MTQDCVSKSILRATYAGAITAVIVVLALRPARASSTNMLTASFLIPPLLLYSLKAAALARQTSGDRMRFWRWASIAAPGVAATLSITGILWLANIRIEELLSRGVRSPASAALLVLYLGSGVLVFTAMGFRLRLYRLAASRRALVMDVASLLIAVVVAIMWLAAPILRNTSVYRWTFAIPFVIWLASALGSLIVIWDPKSLGVGRADRMLALGNLFEAAAFAGFVRALLEHPANLSQSVPTGVLVLLGLAGVACISEAAVAEETAVREGVAAGGARDTWLLPFAPIAGAGILLALLVATAAGAGRDSFRLWLLAIGLTALVGAEAARIWLSSTENRRLYQALTEREATQTAFLREYMSAREQERGQLASEIHDGPVQALTSAFLAMSHAVRLAEQRRTAEAGEKAELAMDTVKEELSALRAIMNRLRPPSLDETGLPAGLRTYAAGTSTRDFAIEVHAAPMPRFAPEVEIALYRIAQEAIENARLHSGARRASVSLVADPPARSVTLMIEDRGQGFETSSDLNLVRAGRFGIVQMRRQAEIAGGTLEITSSPGEGTTVTAVAPFEPLAVAGEPISRMTRGASRKTREAGDDSAPGRIADGPGGHGASAMPDMREGMSA